MDVSIASEVSEPGQGKTGDPVPIKGYRSAIETREGDDWKFRMLTYRHPLMKGLEAGIFPN